MHQRNSAAAQGKNKCARRLTWGDVGASPGDAAVAGNGPDFDLQTLAREDLGAVIPNFHLSNNKAEQRTRLRHSYAASCVQGQQFLDHLSSFRAPEWM